MNKNFYIPKQNKLLFMIVHKIIYFLVKILLFLAAKEKTVEN
jgi:hypothetical protein